MAFEMKQIQLLFIPHFILLSSISCTVLTVEYLAASREIKPAAEIADGPLLCTYFEYRVPHPEEKLSQCIWFRKSSCCTPFESSAFFANQVQFLNPDFNSSLLKVDCTKYLKYLMCFVCAPNHFYFFHNNRLSICGSFCDLLYEKCSDSYIDSDKIVKETYASGKELCLSREFRIVDDPMTSSCFAFDSAWESANRSCLNVMVLLSALLLAFVFTEVSHPVNSLFELVSVLLEIMKQKNTLLSVYLVFLCAILPLLGTTIHVHALTEEEVQSWADRLSRDLKQFGDSAMAFEKFKKLYDNVGYETVAINPAEELKRVHDKFVTFIGEKRVVARNLTKEVKKYNAQYVKSGLAKLNITRTLQDLPSSVYMNADKLFQYNLPPTALKYDYDVGRYLLLSQSTVKIPENLDRHSFPLVDVVNWTSNLDEFLIKSRKLHPDIRHLYYGSELGMLRVYPGLSWVRDLIGFPLDYEPRSQFWYATRKSGTTDIVIIIDGSLSMEGKGLIMAKKVVQIILKMMNHQYNINAIVSASKVYNAKGDVMKGGEAKVLSCSGERLVPATDYTRYELIKAVMDIKASGGSDHLIAFQMAFRMLQQRILEDQNVGKNCRGMIMFITDGKHRDGDVRCSEGTFHYIEDNSKKYTPGNVCRFEYEYLVDMVNLLKLTISPTKVDIFTFLTNDQSDPDDNGEYLAGRLACQSNGVMSKIITDSDYFGQMQPFFTYLGKTDASHEIFVTSSYSSFGDTNFIVAVTQPVFISGWTDRIGVVGVDFLVEKLELLLRNSLWSDAHAFVAVLTDGSVLIHPLKRPSYMPETATYIGIQFLETEAGMPEEFSSVLRKILSRTSGSVEINKNPGRTALYKRSTVLCPTTSSEYFISYVEDTDYVIGINVFEQDLTFRKLKTFTGQAGTSYLHTLLAAKPQPQTAQLVADLSPILLVNAGKILTEINISMKHTVVAIAPVGFCSVSQFYEQYLQKNLEYINLQNAINEAISNKSTESCDLLNSDAQKDIRITSAIEEAWFDRPADVIDAVVSTYFLTVNGVMRIFPGIPIPISELLGMAYQDWYQHALLHRGILSMTTEHLSRFPQVNVITLVKAFLRGDIDCTEATQKTCTELGVMAVLAADVKRDKFYERIMASLKSAATKKGRTCGSKYPCEHSGRETECETKCILMDRESQIIVPHLRNAFNKSVQLLADKFPFILTHLVNLGVFTMRERMVSPVDCNADEAVQKEHFIYARPIMDTVSEGPVPKYSPELLCTHDLIYYVDNRTRLAELGGIVSGTLDDNPCANGQYFVTLVKDTSTYLVVIDDYEDLSANPFNFLCLLSLEALSTYRKPVDQSIVECKTTSSEMLEIEKFAQSCSSRSEAMLMGCGYSEGNRSRQHQSLIFVLIFAVFLLS